jgi:hypothetical protein
MRSERPCSARGCSGSITHRLPGANQCHASGATIMSPPPERVSHARLGLVHDVLERGELVEPFGARRRLRAPGTYWMLPLPGAVLRPELRLFLDWLRAQAAITRAAIGDDDAADAAAAMPRAHRKDAAKASPRARRRP